MATFPLCMFHLMHEAEQKARPEISRQNTKA